MFSQECASCMREESTGETLIDSILWLSVDPCRSAKYYNLSLGASEESVEVRARLGEVAGILRCGRLVEHE
jgi:hypothetical protein